ncbi:MRPL3 (YMR024W) [Zygosaccharomyces parabailii]|nr:MRPL3 (YMR024W) [Zygosaccharomyces parabailii]CDH16708.1 related to 54S ribosomal protein L3,mitochondrial [Zygosaccharomyces bailii ISA1307]SJM88786.1 related to 54S ribosomal protein L3, mitochondrial [Zygosaccharomyces bailii]
MSQLSAVTRHVTANRYMVSRLALISRLKLMPVGKMFSSSFSQTNSNPIKSNSAELDKYRSYYMELKNVINDVPEGIASKSPELVTLHKRLQLPQDFPFSVLSRCLTCRSSQLPNEISNPRGGSAFTSTVPTNNFFDNYGLNIFGKNLLTYHVTRKLMAKYPRLPTVVLNAAVDAYISEDVLAGIGKSWGIESERTPVLERYLKNEPIHITLGKLRFFNNSLSQNDGIELVSSHNFSEKSAYSLAIRSIIGALWACTQESNPQYAFQFIDKHILSRKLDITKMFQFEQPTRELATLCRREGLERPISRLLAESGRYSKAPVFIVGVFSGQEKLGEGFGSSLKEGKAKAATDALMKWYCYEPLEGQAPVVDHGTVIV